VPTRLLLDTDIGSDIDDAVCLAYLLAQPECDLMGITTVSGRPLERASLASALCRVANKFPPIYPGTELPLIVPPRQTDVPQAEALARWPHDLGFAQHEAIDFLRRTIRQNPGEITLLTIGPLTNAALLFKLDPEIPRLLKSLVMMAGAYLPPMSENIAEWNSLLDPHAAAIVFAADVPVVRCVGLDVTLKVMMMSEEVQRRFDAPLLRAVYDFAESWFRQRPDITFHDPLAAAVMFDGSICQFQRGVVSVEINDAAHYGRLTFAPGEGRHEVAVSVDPARFFEHFFVVAGSGG
jgi:inosine-uridine nucleoside N-ribohydrolase